MLLLRFIAALHYLVVFETGIADVEKGCLSLYTISANDDLLSVQRRARSYTTLVLLSIRMVGLPSNRMS